MTSPHKPAFPLFFLAALSFVPGAGILAGSMAATWGLLSSRPKAMRAAVIGATGALLQIIGVVIWMLFSAPSSPATQQVSLEVTRQDLLKLVRALDAYHTSHGVYPATLVELQRGSLVAPFVNIYDPAAGVLHLPYPYQYHVAPDGKSYDLYSSGPDRIPDTEDDIRPRLPDAMRAQSGYSPPVEHLQRHGVIPIQVGSFDSLSVDRGFKYAGAQRFVLGGIADAEQHLFVVADSGGRVERLVWIQLEERLPTAVGSYDYSSDSSVVLNGLTLAANVRRYESGPEPGSDRARAFALLKSRGYTVPPGAARLRLTFLPESPARREVMIVYLEAGAAPLAAASSALRPLLEHAAAAVRLWGSP